MGELIDFLSAESYLNITSGKFPLLLLSAQGLKVLKGQIKVYRKASLIIESKTKFLIILMKNVLQVFVHFDLN